MGRVIIAHAADGTRIVRRIKELLAHIPAEEGVEVSRLRWFVEYEDAPVSLERLHRLYVGYRKERRCKGALFVGGDQPMQTPTRDAVTWARGRNTLEVIHLPDLYSTLARAFP
jgi:hypothetical protein